MDRKLIIAIVQPFLVDKIVAALEAIEHFPGITLTEAEGFGKKRKNSLDSPINPFHPKKQIEIAVVEEMVEPIVNAINKNAHTGKLGDGMIFILPIEQTIRI
ncbi:MAG: P-II family nitrogen regulator [Pyrinomonadaceae bacterium]|nr:P-II family nitrogen regulator [Pyrinomonadaceae bacterium]